MADTSITRVVVAINEISFSRSSSSLIINISGTQQENPPQPESFSNLVDGPLVTNAIRAHSFARRDLCGVINETSQCAGDGTSKSSLVNRPFLIPAKSQLRVPIAMILSIFVVRVTLVVAQTPSICCCNAETINCCPEDVCDILIC